MDRFKNSLGRSLIFAGKNPQRGERVEALIRKLGMVTEEFGHQIGVSGQTVRLWTKGDGISHKNVIAILDKFGLTQEWLEQWLAGEGDLGDPPINPIMIAQGGETRRRAIKMPIIPASLNVLSTKPEGSEPYMQLFADVILERRPRPDNVFGNGDVTGIFVSNNVMSPVFSYGDVVWTDPLLPPTENSKVVIYGENGQEPGSQPMIIAILVNISDSEWTVQVMEPEKKQIVLDRSKWHTCHRIVGSYCRQ